LFVKHDGLVHPEYGGNKTRKAKLLLEDAVGRGARRILTIGAAGSHHVLALARFAPVYGLSVVAVLTPQPYTPHAENNLRVALGRGLEAWPSASALEAVARLARVYRRGDYVLAPGGSTPLGASAYALALDELVEQVAAGELPDPDWIVVPLGSGGTAAGLLAGAARRRLRARILAVSTLRNRFAALWTRRLAARCLRHLGEARALQLDGLVIDDSQIGAGYGAPSLAGARAAEEAARFGIELEPTYTQKAFASALSLARGEHPLAPRPGVVLFWNTLAVSAPGGADLAVPPLPAKLQRLFATEANGLSRR
jgi:D-cysteine desulfhydrase